MHPILSRSAHILVIEPQNTLRSAMLTTLKETGFARVEPAGSIYEVVVGLANGSIERPDWIFTSLMDREKFHGMHMLNHFIRDDKLHPVRISFMLEEEDHYCIPNAFEMGLLSYHTKPFNKDQFTKELEELFTKLEETKENFSLTSAIYLRRYLLENEKYADLLRLEKSLQEVFPEDTTLFYHIAEAQFLNKSAPEALKTLKLAEHLSKEQAERSRDLMKKYLGDAENQASTVTFGAAFRIKSCILVETDSLITRELGKQLKDKMGIADVQIFSDGAAAWKYISAKPEPGMIVMEWVLPVMTGLTLLQRIRHMGYTRVPVFILSSRLQQEDRGILDEMNVAGIARKPPDYGKLIDKFIGTIRKGTLTSNEQEVEMQIRQALDAGDYDSAFQLRDRFRALPDYSGLVDMRIKCAFSFYERRYEEAKEFLVETVKLDPDSLYLNNLLAKTFMHLRDFDMAMLCFNKVNSLSPDNLDRMCEMANTQALMGEFEKAEDTINDAEKVDDDSDKVKEAKATIAISAGKKEKAKSIMQGLKSLSGVVSMMNNQAVVLARQGRLEKGIALYNKALASLPDDRPKVRGIVLYNLGMGYARNNQLKEAMECLKEVTRIPRHNLAKRASSLYDRIRKSVEHGTELKLGQLSPVGIERGGRPSYTINDTRPFAIDAKRGELCCHLVYSHKGGLDQAVARLIKTEPPSLTKLAKKAG